MELLDFNQNDLNVYLHKKFNIKYKNLFLSDLLLETIHEIFVFLKKDVYESNVFFYKIDDKYQITFDDINSYYEKFIEKIKKFINENYKKLEKDLNLIIDNFFEFKTSYIKKISKNKYEIKIPLYYSIDKKLKSFIIKKFKEYTKEI